MKKYYFLILTLVLVACNAVKKPMESRQKYDLLVSGDYGGGAFRFYELITEENEFKMLLSDDIIKKYIRKDDIKDNNFILINLGEKAKEGYTIKIKKVVESKDKITLTISEVEPKSATIETPTKPYFVLKVKSKKSIEILE
jgi:hypothetical protein